MKTKITKVKCCKETIYGLTFGKIYDVIEENFMFFKLVDDNSKTTWVIKDNFWDASNEQAKRNSSDCSYIRSLGQF